MECHQTRFDPNSPRILTGPYASQADPSSATVVANVEPRDVNPLITYVTNPSMKKRLPENTPFTDTLSAPR
jgi:hypothetical protein